MQQISENNKDLKRIINQITLPLGEISLSGMICQSQYGKLQEDIGAEKNRQGKAAA